MLTLTLENFRFKQYDMLVYHNFQCCLQSTCTALWLVTIRCYLLCVDYNRVTEIQSQSLEFSAHGLTSLVRGDPWAILRCKMSSRVLESEGAIVIIQVLTLLNNLICIINFG